MKAKVTALFALALLAAGSLAAPAIASSTATSVAHVSSRSFGSPSQIPWSSVGPGWTLTTWSPSAPSNPHQAAPYLVLTNQSGGRYVVLRQTGALARAQLLDWSAFQQRALFFVETNAGTATVLIVSLRTGTIANKFAVPASDDFQTAGFTSPDGLAVVVLTYVHGLVFTRDSLTGQRQLTYPTTTWAIGRFTGSWLYSPSGAELVFGAEHGLVVATNGGITIAQLRLAGSSGCQPLHWWTTGIVLASCAVGAHQENRLYTFHVAGGTPAALTRPNVPPDSGDLGAWRVSGHVYVQVASACGYVYLAKLAGHAPIMVNVPGIPSGHSVHVVGASSTSIAIESNVACNGGTSLGWYTPSSDSTRIVLGPPATGGQAGIAVAYPSPDD